MSTVDSSNSGAWSQTLSALSGAMSSYLQDKMTKKMDADGSGGVEQSEFQAALEKVAGKLGIEVGEGASELYASLDADQNGSLNSGEVGSLLQSLFASASNTQAFVQSRGDEARFAELDADSDGQISMAEFGITPAAETTVVQTTTVVTTTHEAAVNEATTGVAEAAGATGTNAVAALVDASQEQAVASADPAVAEGSSLQALIQSVDTDGNGEISTAELNTFVAKLNAQAEAATKRYNDTALASLGSQSSTLDATA
jgi:Ca2+-binding EF-hand superfamily protein